MNGYRNQQLDTYRTYVIKEHIKERLKEIPKKPGIYKMIDKQGHIIYVGKSLCLRNRVRSYFVSNHKWNKIQTMVHLIEEIEYEVTDTHMEARLLECKLIKELRPHFNAQMKSEERYMYLSIEKKDQRHPFKVGKVPSKDSFGPYRSKTMLYNTIEVLQHIWPLERKNGKLYFSYHVIPEPLTDILWEENQSILRRLVTSKELRDELLRMLEDKMVEASKDYRFEQAARYRDIIEGLQYIFYGMDGYKELEEKKMVVTIAVDKEWKFFYIYQGDIYFSKCYKTCSKERVQSFRTQCENNKIPKLQLYAVNLTDKARKDYVSIIYSEIMSLDKEQVHIYE